MEKTSRLVVVQAATWMEWAYRSWARSVWHCESIRLGAVEDRRRASSHRKSVGRQTAAATEARWLNLQETGMKPVFIDHPLMQVAFRDFVLWLWDEPDMRAAFEKDTGTVPLREPRCQLDVMIDQAAGVNRAYADKFMEWAVKQWGEDESSGSIGCSLVP
jgi:hypothetical protein